MIPDSARILRISDVRKYLVESFGDLVSDELIDSYITNWPDYDNREIAQMIMARIQV